MKGGSPPGTSAHEQAGCGHHPRPPGRHWAVQHKAHPAQRVRGRGRTVCLSRLYAAGDARPTAHPQPTTGTGAHPHRGIATLTYLLSDEGLHRDSRGAQWMNAGSPDEVAAKIQRHSEALGWPSGHVGWARCVRGVGFSRPTGVAPRCYQPTTAGLTRLARQLAASTGASVFHPATTRMHGNSGWLDAHRSFLPHGASEPSRHSFGALIILNDDTVAAGAGFGMHAHQNAEIVTILLEGALEHQDTLGNKGVSKNNELQVISAGS
nr:hypothetical protein [Tanacetum cinerariifolium]